MYMRRIITTNTNRFLKNEGFGTLPISLALLLKLNFAIALAASRQPTGPASTHTKPSSQTGPSQRREVIRGTELDIGEKVSSGAWNP